MQHDHNPFILEQETIDLLKIVEEIYPEQLDWINCMINQEVRKVVLQKYAEYLDYKSEERVRDKVRQKNATR